MFIATNNTKFSLRYKRDVTARGTKDIAILTVYS